MSLREMEVRYAEARPKPYKLADGGGLYALVQPSGSKLWRLKYRYGGKEKVLAFGAYPVVSLADAREKRLSAKRVLADGRDPGAEIQAARALADYTLETVARAWHENRKDSLEPAHYDRVLARMERDVFPAIGKMQISKITAPDVLAMVRKIEARGALDISRRAMQSVAGAWRFAKASGWVTTGTNPATDLHDALQPRPKVQRMNRLPIAQLGEFLRRLERYDGEEETKDAIWFTLLTWGRTTETRFARYQEFEHLDGKSNEPLWRIPGERMKMDREHLVPLSPQAVAVIRRAAAYRRNDFLFPGDRKREQISETTMINACYRMGFAGRQTIHGLRGIASTWANESGDYEKDWVEMALSHGESDAVRAAYNSAEYLKPRRKMLADWGAMVQGLEATSEFDELLG